MNAIFFSNFPPWKKEETTRGFSLCTKQWLKQMDLMW